MMINKLRGLQEGPIEPVDTEVEPDKGFDIWEKVVDLFEHIFGWIGVDIETKQTWEQAIIVVAIAACILLVPFIIYKGCFARSRR